MDDPAFHEVANIFPLMGDAELDALAVDITSNRLREPIWRHRDGRIVDGRNRWLACAKAGVECHSHEYPGDDASLVAFVLSQNLHRRHLTESQRSMVAGRIATRSVGNPSMQPIDQIGVSNAQAADMLKVSYANVSRARRAIRAAEPEVIDAVDKGQLSVSAALNISRHKPEKQAEMLSAHARNGGNGRRTGTPQMKANPAAPSRLRVVHDRDDGLVEQVCGLVLRLGEVSLKTGPEALHGRFPEKLMHNLDLSLETATSFLIGLRDAHRARTAEKKNAAG